MKYSDAVKDAYNTSKYKDIISEDNYVLLSRIFISFVYITMNSSKLLRIRFPGLCLFYPSVKQIKRSIESLNSRNEKPERVIELNNILNNLSTNGKIKQKKVRKPS